MRRESPKKVVRYIALCLAAAAVLLPRYAASDTPRLAEPGLARQIEGRVTLAWHGQEIGAALARLAEARNLPIWLDRRVDPHAAVELAVENVPLGEALDGLAALHDEQSWGWTTLGAVVYFGPRTTARDLATVSVVTRQQLAKTPADMRKRWLTGATWTIPRLSDSRTLLRNVLEPLGASIANEGDLPHDVWAAHELPSVAPVDRLVLLVAGFDIAAVPAANGKSWRLAPIKHPMRIGRAYPSNARTEAALAELTASSQLDVKREGRRVIVAGRWEDHELLREAIRGDQREEPRERRAQRSGRRGGGEQRFTLRIENKPAGRVLEQLAAQLRLTLVWETNEAARDAAVSCDVREADLDRLLEAVTSSAGLAFVHDGETVTIRAAQ